MYIGLHVKCPFFLLDFLDRFSKKYLNIKFHNNPSCESQAVMCRWMGRYDEANRCV